MTTWDDKQETIFLIFCTIVSTNQTWNIECFISKNDAIEALRLLEEAKEEVQTYISKVSVAEKNSIAYFKYVGAIIEKLHLTSTSFLKEVVFKNSDFQYDICEVPFS